MRRKVRASMLQKSMDSDSKPLQTVVSDDRLIVRPNDFLDTITAIGQVAEKQDQGLDEIQYQYPLITVMAPHLREPSPRPRFFFGLGVSKQL
jgi:starvation-inducible outer membrane lipoprotein